MDCFNHSCPFRVNDSSSLHRCECTACPNRDMGSSGYCTITWNKTLTKEEMDEIKRRLDQNYDLKFGEEVKNV